MNRNLIQLDSIFLIGSENGFPDIEADEYVLNATEITNCYGHQGLREFTATEAVFVINLCCNKIVNGIDDVGSMA